MNAVQFSPTAQHLLVQVSAAGHAQVWAQDSLTCMTLQSGASVITTLVWSVDGQHIVAGTTSGNVVVWDAATSAVRHRTKLRGTGGGAAAKDVVALCAAPSCVFAMASGLLFEIDTVTGVATVVDGVSVERVGAAGSLLANADGTRLAIASATHVVMYALDPEGRVPPRKIARYGGHSQLPSALAFAEENAFVTADAKVPTLMLWGDGAEASSGPSSCIASTSCGAVVTAIATRRRQLLSVHTDGSVMVWKVSRAEIHNVRSINLTGQTCAAFVSKQTIVVASLSDVVPLIRQIDIEKELVPDAPREGKIVASGGVPSRVAGGLSVVASALPGKYEENDAEWEDGAAGTMPTKTVSMTLVLRQALRTQDTESLRKVIFTTDTEYIDVTVQSIPPSHAAFFLRQCTQEFQDPNGRTERTQLLLAWVRAVIRHHGGHIRTLPNAYALLAPLRGVLGEFTRLTPMVSTFVGRLGVLCSVATEYEEDARSKGPPRHAVQRFELLGDGQVTRQ